MKVGDYVIKISLQMQEAVENLISMYAVYFTIQMRWNLEIQKLCAFPYNKNQEDAPFTFNLIQ
jgi:hypothetical protein